MRAHYVPDPVLGLGIHQGGVGKAKILYIHGIYILAGEGGGKLNHKYNK